MQTPLDAARIELKRLLSERGVLERKIQAIQEAISLLEPVYRDQSSTLLYDMMRPEMGITARIRKLLEANAGQGFTPTQIRDLLVASGYKLTGNNPMATIHTVLKRIKESDPRVTTVQDNAGNTLYRFDHLPQTEGAKRR